jgi:ATP-dependent 26S proteasome regulatory subunit
MRDESDTDKIDKEEKLKEEYEEEIRAIKRRYEREVASLKFEVQRKEEKLEVLEDTLDKVKKPPLLYAYIIRLIGDDLGDGNAVVARGNDILKVSIGIMDKPKLKLGQFVWVHPQTYSIVQLSCSISMAIQRRGSSSVPRRC